MGNTFFIGMIMAIPPYGFLLKPLGVTAQGMGCFVQFIGLILLTWNLAKII